jgi:hypothetical protein
VVVEVVVGAPLVSEDDDELESDEELSPCGQSCAAFDTASPWARPWTEWSWATADTQAPWLVAVDVDVDGPAVVVVSETTVVVVSASVVGVSATVVDVSATVVDVSPTVVDVTATVVDVSDSAGPGVLSAPVAAAATPPPTSAPSVASAATLLEMNPARMCLSRDRCFPSD